MSPRVSIGRNLDLQSVRAVARGGEPVEIDRAASEAMARTRARLEAELESALLSKNLQRREAAFVFILPELVQVDPPRVVAMVARQEPGEARDTLLSEVTRAWSARDPGAAAIWMQTLPEHERLKGFKAARE